jgi:hypothetical protein
MQFNGRLSAFIKLSDAQELIYREIPILANHYQSKYPRLAAVLNHLRIVDCRETIARNGNGSISYTGK